MVRHWMPTPATSYNAKYLEPRPKAVVDIRDWKRRVKQEFTHLSNIQIIEVTLHSDDTRS